MPCPDTSAAASPKRLDRRRQHEIRRQLEHVRVLRQRADAPGLLADRVENGLHAVDRVARARRRRMLSLPAAATSGRPSTGAATYATPCCACSSRQFVGERDRDRRHVHVDEAVRRVLEQAAVDQDRAQRGVVGEHREHGVAGERLLGRIDDRRALVRERASCARGERFQTRTVCPAFSVLPAIAPPISPSPMKPMSMSCSFLVPEARKKPRAPVEHIDPKHAAPTRCDTRCMVHARFRFHRELNEFLARPLRGQAFACACAKAIVDQAHDRSARRAAHGSRADPA